MYNIKAAQHINTLGQYCGRRDIASLSHEQLTLRYGFAQADVMVLFGGSILCGAELLADAMHSNLAKKYMIVGGEGHTTQSLRQQMQQECPEIDTVGLTEAEIYDDYINHRYGLRADLLEKASTNCGNNVTHCLALLKRHQIEHNNILIVQDATMQQRMDATFRKFAPDVTVINFASYSVNVVCKDGQLCFKQDVWGMWDMQRYITLLMGEIPRLMDNADGYGPKGKDYIAHVDIPESVLHAFEYLKKDFGSLVRTANPLYAT